EGRPRVPVTLPGAEPLDRGVTDADLLADRVASQERLVAAGVRQNLRGPVVQILFGVEDRVVGVEGVGLGTAEAAWVVRGVTPDLDVDRVGIEVLVLAGEVVPAASPTALDVRHSLLPSLARVVGSRGQPVRVVPRGGGHVIAAWRPPWLPAGGDG